MRQVGLFRIRQLSFAKSASLKHWISLNERPPTSFPLVSLSQTTQHIFFLPFVASHPNLVRVDCILLQRLAGSLKQDIVYVGIEDKTDCNMTIFFAVDKCLEDQLIALCLILSTMRLKRSFFLVPKCFGRPRYFPKPPPYSYSLMDK